MFPSRFFALPVAFLLVFPILAHATITSSQIVGSCKIENTNKCSISAVPDVSHDKDTPVQGIRILANGQLLYEWQNDSSNPESIHGASFNQGGARCGHQYKLQLYAKASDDSDFRKVGETLEIQCPKKVPK
jgi:hypothetical protein